MAFDYLDSDSEYDEGPPLDRSENSGGTMKLRDPSRRKPPKRYQLDLEPIGPGRPIFVHEDPIFNMDRAKFVQWRSLNLDEPSPGEAQYRFWQEQGEPRDAFGHPVMSPYNPGQAAESPGPVVAHLRRQSTAVRPYVSQPVVDSIEQKDEFDEAFEANLAGFEELQTDDDDESVMVYTQLSSEYKDWSTLSGNVQWAIIYDLANDHEDGITAAANLLGLTIDDVVSFINLYVREKTLWEKGTYYDEPNTPFDASFQLDGAQHEVEQPVEAEADQVMYDFEPDQQDHGARATQTVTDAEVSPSFLEGLHDTQHEPELKPFHEPDTQPVVENGIGQLGAEKVANQTGFQAGDEQSAPAAWPPAVELITDSFSREDIGSGRGFLTFVGLQEYADGFGQWFGRGTTFREIPGIFDENNDFVFSAKDTEEALYINNEVDWQGPVPRLAKGPQQREWLMEPLPQDWERRHNGPGDPPSQQFHALAERVNAPPISLHDNDDRFFGSFPEGAYGGLRYGEPAPAITFSDVLADKKTDKGVARRFHEMRHVDINEAYDMRKSMPPTYPPPQLLPFLQPHESVMQGASRLKHAFASLGHNSKQVPSSEQASQDTSKDPLSATPHAMPTQSIEVSSKPDARTLAEMGTHEVRVTAGPALSSAVNSATPSDGEGPVELGQVSENGIEVHTFPKCHTCFRVRARCDGVRPCSSCVKRNRNCKDVTKADLDGFPDRAERVMKDKARADGMAAQTGGPGRVRETAPPHDSAVADLAASHTTAAHTAATGTKRKVSAMTAGTSSGEDESDLDDFPPEKEDPTDGDFGLGPKKKRPKKGNTPIGKKPKPSQAKAGVPATATPTKRRGPYKKKVDGSAPKPNELIAGGNSTPTTQSGGSASAGNLVTATSARNPAAVEETFASSYQTAGDESLLGVGPGRSVNDAAEAVRHVGGQSGITKVRPVPVGKRHETPKLVETHNVLDPSLTSSNPSHSAGDPRYLDIPFAPVVTRPHTPTGRFIPGVPMPQLSRSVAGSPDAALRTSPYGRAHPMPVARGQFIPPRPRTISAENGQRSGSELYKTAASPKTPMTLQEMRSVTIDSMPLVPQIARPGLNGPLGATDISPTSQSSSSGTTVSMDFLNIPFTPSEEAYSRDVSVSGRLPQSSVDYPSMPSFSPDLSAGRMPMDTPTASQRRRAVSSHNIGAHGSGANVPSPVMEADAGFAVAPGLGSSYATFQQQRPISRPISRMQQGLDYSVPPQMMHPSGPSSVFYGRQFEEMRPGSRSVSASPASQQHSTALPRPAKRQADASLYHGQQPAKKRPRGPASPLAPPREAGSWKELARSQWANETQENQPAYED